jgi:hypothetical protein
MASVERERGGVVAPMASVDEELGGGDDNRGAGAASPPPTASGRRRPRHAREPGPNASTGGMSSPLAVFNLASAVVGAGKP